MPVMMKRSIGVTPPSSRTVCWGSTCGSRCGSVVNASSIAACRVSSTPSDATSLPSGAELRSGRKMPSSTAAATPISKARATISAGALAIVKPSWPVLSAQNA